VREGVSREGKEVCRRTNSKREEGCKRRKATNFKTKNKMLS
jgi:hypothetical protein